MFYKLGPCFFSAWTSMQLQSTLPSLELSLDSAHSAKCKDPTIKTAPSDVSGVGKPSPKILPRTTPDKVPKYIAWVPEAHGKICKPRTKKSCPSCVQRPSINSHPQVLASCLEAPSIASLAQNGNEINGSASNVQRSSSPPRDKDRTQQ